MWGTRWAVQMNWMGWDVSRKQITGSFECCYFVCFFFFFFGCAFIFWSLFPHTCSFTAFIALCLTELLSQNHKPDENQSCFLLSANRQAQGFVTLTVRNFLWHQAGEADASHCPPISLPLSAWGWGECTFLLVSRGSKHIWWQWSEMYFILARDQGRQWLLPLIEK